MNALAQVAAGAAFLLLVAGGLVTSTGSSLSVPDWPLSFGKAFPPMVGGVLFEHGHRVIAGAVSLLTFTLTWMVHRREERPWVRGLAYAASAAILVQAVLGGLTVLLRLPPAVSISHACLGQAVFCLILALTQATSPWYLSARTRAEGVEDLWKAGAAAIAAVYLQLVWGALLRHTGQGLLLHVGWALAAVCAVSALVCKAFLFHRAEPALTRPAGLLAALLPLQLLLGYTAFRIRSAPDFVYGFHSSSLLTTAHLAVGAAILGTSVVWTLRAHRLGAG